MGSHPDFFNGPQILENLIYEAMLYVHPPRIGTVQITNQLLEWRRISKGFVLQYLKQPLDLRTEIGRCDFLSVLLCLLSKVEIPIHQFRVLEDLMSGSFNPKRMDSRIPGSDTRYSVS